MRMGLASLKEDALPVHPVETIQNQHSSSSLSNQFQMLKDLYGVAVPAKLQIETQILGKFQRLPGLPSSKLGLASLTGELDEFDFESYIGLPELSEVPPPGLHEQMESKLGMGTQPSARGFL